MELTFGGRITPSRWPTCRPASRSHECSIACTSSSSLVPFVAGNCLFNAGPPSVGSSCRSHRAWPHLSVQPQRRTTIPPLPTLTPSTNNLSISTLISALDGHLTTFYTSYDYLLHCFFMSLVVCWTSVSSHKSTHCPGRGYATCSRQTNPHVPRFADRKSDTDYFSDMLT